MKDIGRRRLGVVVAMLCAGIAAGCSSSSSGGTTTPPAENTHIVIARMDWLGANLSEDIVKHLLEDKMGFTTEFHTFADHATANQFPSLASGESHVALELWPSGHKEDIAKYIDTDMTVENAGAVGATAKKGFFIPDYMVKDHPELANWMTYTDPKAVAIFQTADTAADNKGRLLSGDPSWSNYHDEIIKNLGLQLETKYAGTEDAELAELAAAYAKQKPILLYLWLPHWAFNPYPMTAVQLPAYTDDCWAKHGASGVNCDYPTETLTKLAWAGLKNYSPRAYAFIHAVTFTTKQQIDMMAAVQAGAAEDDVAKKWITDNEAIWKAWIPAK